ncbi:hypothetical protein ACLOJK_008180 [Asimina triloba]
MFQVGSFHREPMVALPDLSYAILGAKLDGTHSGAPPWEPAALHPVGGLHPEPPLLSKGPSTQLALLSPKVLPRRSFMLPFCLLRLFSSPFLPLLLSLFFKKFS